LGGVTVRFASAISYPIGIRRENGEGKCMIVEAGKGKARSYNDNVLL
jgi:hypothetical protein